MTTALSLLVAALLLATGCATGRPLSGSYPHVAVRGQTLQDIRADEARCDRRAGGESASYIACMLTAGYVVRVKIPWAAVSPPPDYLIQPPPAGRTVAPKIVADCVASAQATRLIDTFPSCLRAHGLVSQWGARP
jgi:hypothetical protein